MSVAVNWNEIIPEFKNYQSRKHCGQSCDLQFELINDNRDYSSTQEATCGFSPAKRKMVHLLTSSWFLSCKHNCMRTMVITQAKFGPASAPALIFLRAMRKHKAGWPRIGPDLQNTSDWHWFTSLTTVVMANPFVANEWCFLHCGWYVEVQQCLCKNSTMITDIFRWYTDRVAYAGAGITYSVSGPNGIYDHLKIATVASRYDWRLLMPFSPWAPDWMTDSDCCEERELSALTLFYIIKQCQQMWINPGRSNTDRC